MLKDRALLLASRVLPAFAVSALASRLKPSKGIRSTLLRRQAAGLSSMMRSLGFRQDMLVRADGSLFVYSDGVLLNAAGTNRYLKISHSTEGNQGAGMARMLARFGIDEPRNILDLGANFGEISLYFSRRFPAARIVAVEPSSENLKILRSNLSVQAFPTDNIAVVQAAVSDRDGTIAIGTGRGSENSVVIEHQRRDAAGRALSEEVPALTLVSLFEQQALDRVDFMKVDVEGAEPLMLDSLAELSQRIGATLIEMGSKQPPDAHLPLFDQFEATGFSIFSEDGTAMEDAAAAKAYYLRKRAEGTGEDFWFVRNPA